MNHLRLAAVSLMSFTACTGSAPDDGGDSAVLSIVGTDDAIDTEKFLGSISPEQAAKYLHPINGTGIVSFAGGTCTGWFISSRYVITNQHCVHTGPKDVVDRDKPDHMTAGICEGLTVRLNYTNPDQSFRNLQMQAAPSGTYRCRRIHLANQARDLAILEVDSDAPVTPLRLAASAAAGQRVLTIGHPAGQPKKISYYNRVGSATRWCQTREPSYPPGKTASDAPNPYYAAKFPHSIVHDCDTRGGSSGSPLLDLNSLEVVGLHWDGWLSSKWPYYHEQGSTDQESDDSNELPYLPGNVAIRIEVLRAYVQSQADGLPQDLVQIFR